MCLYGYTAATRLRNYRRKAWENAARIAAEGLPWPMASLPTDWRVIARQQRHSATTGSLGAAMESGGQWCENPAAIGLRWVGWADELFASRRYARDIHIGWFTDSDGMGGEVLRGCVWQLPGRDGQARYVPGYREGSDSRRHGWQDTAGNDSPSVLFLGRIESGLGADSYDLKYEAARVADSEAEPAAESEREWREAWQAGNRWASLGSDISEARRQALALIREVKAGAGRLCDIGPAVAAAVRRQMESARETVATLKSERAELWQQWEHLREPRNHWCRRLWEAFSDGAGVAISSR